jgi:parallel beta-helix repeat protein
MRMPAVVASFLVLLCLQCGQANAETSVDAGVFGGNGSEFIPFDGNSRSKPLVVSQKGSIVANVDIIGADGDGITIIADNCTLLNCTVKQCTKNGIVIKGKNCAVIKCSAEKNKDSGIVIRGDNCRVAGSHGNGNGGNGVEMLASGTAMTGAGEEDYKILDAYAKAYPKVVKSVRARLLKRIE